MPTNIDYKSIASILVNGEPLDFKAYPDGALVVIAPTGQKFKFTPEQVQAVAQKIQPEPKPKPDQKPAAKPSANRKRPQKAAQDSKKVKS